MVDAKHLVKDSTFENELAEHDYAILSGVQSAGQTHPTRVQADALRAAKGGAPYFLSVQGGFRTGKTQAALLLMLIELVKKKGTVPKAAPEARTSATQEATPVDAEDSLHGYFAVILCSSKESTNRNMALADALLSRECRKRARVRCVNVNQDASTVSLVPHTQYLVFGTPANFMRFSSAMQFARDAFVGFVFDEIDYQLAFGYGTELDAAVFRYGTVFATAGVVVTFTAAGDDARDVEDFRAKIGRVSGVPQEVVVKATSNVSEDDDGKSGAKKKKKKKRENEDDDDSEDQNDDSEGSKKSDDEESAAQKEETALHAVRLQDYRLVSQFYSIGDALTRMIVVYVLFRLHFFVGKSLILVRNTDEVYRMQQFLERIGVRSHQVYNHEDPKNLRYYILTVFNTGVVDVLVATPQVLEDLRAKTFARGRARKILHFRNLDNILLTELIPGQVDYEHLFGLFRGNSGTIVACAASHDARQVETLAALVEAQRARFSDSITIKEFPLRQSELDAFKYRISDVVRGISRKQVDAARLLDFKRKLFKSKDMADYFAQNVVEKELILADIQRLAQQIAHNAVRCDQDVPEYLVPPLIREYRKRREEQAAAARAHLPQAKREKLLVRAQNKDFDKSLKRRMEHNNLSIDDVKKKIKTGTDQFVTLDKEHDDNPDEVDASRLKIISSRKLWKLKHGFKLKRHNRRLEKKGVFIG